MPGEKKARCQNNHNPEIHTGNPKKHQIREWCAASTTSCASARNSHWQQGRCSSKKGCENSRGPGYGFFTRVFSHFSFFPLRRGGAAPSPRFMATTPKRSIDTLDDVETSPPKSPMSRSSSVVRFRGFFLNAKKNDNRFPGVFFFPSKKKLLILFLPPRPLSPSLTRASQTLCHCRMIFFSWMTCALKRLCPSLESTHRRYGKNAHFFCHRGKRHYRGRSVAGATGVSTATPSGGTSVLG